MSTAATISIADEVKTLLTNGTFSMTCTVRRAYSPVYQLTDSTLYVLVVPRSRKREFVARTILSNDHEIDVGILKKLSSPESLSEIDPLAGLCDEISTYLLDRSRRLLSTSKAGLVKVETQLLYSPEHIKELQQFTAVLRLTYKVTEATT